MDMYIRCVETYTSYNSIVRRFEKQIKQGEISSVGIDGDSRNDVIKDERIIKETKNGDSLALRIIEETGQVFVPFDSKLK